MSETIILHGMGSPNVIKVVLMLEECGLDYEMRYVDVFHAAQYDPDFLALNPLGKAPVIEDPRLGIPLAESGAILLWLAEREGRFLPEGQPERAEAWMWLMVQMANIGPMFGQLNHFNIVGAAEEPYSHGRYHAASKKLYGILESRLSSREWIAGGDYSVADMATQPWGDYLERHGFDPGDYPALVEWRERIRARPAVQRAHARVKESFLGTANPSTEPVTKEHLDRFFGRTDEVPEKDFSAVLRMT